MRFRILKTEHFKFRTGAAYMFETERYDLPANSVHPAATSFHRLTSYITLKYQLNKLLSLISTTYYQPRFTDLKDFKLFSENAFLFDTGKVLVLFVKISLRYESRPPDKVKNFDAYSGSDFDSSLAEDDFDYGFAFSTGTKSSI